MTSFDFVPEVKRMRALADQAQAMADATGLMKWFNEVDYYNSLADRLDNLSWHYACLENEGILK